MRALGAGMRRSGLAAVSTLLLPGLLLSGCLRHAEAQDRSRECLDWQSRRPAWIFCDDLETDAPMVGPGRYFEYGDDEGDFVPLQGAGLEGSRGLRTVFQAGEVSAGGMKLSFGRNPNGYMRRGIRPDEDFREIYYRMYLRMQPGWIGNPAKLSRATVFTRDQDWSQAMIAHLWSDGKDHLLVDPVRCVDDRNQVKCVGYNDFEHMDWLGYQPGRTPIFSTELAGAWHCVEAHVRLNDPGESDGLQEFWIDGRLEARREGLDFVRAYTDYAINAIFFENYWNDGSPREQVRYFDNLVVSTEPIGCLAGGGPEATPTRAPEEPTASATPRTAAGASPTPTGPLPARSIHLPHLRR